MRIRALRLIAFGPFRDRTLRFDHDGALELVFGPNEAGKSTTRRAVLGLLFGIPQRSKDGHSVGEVRVGATVEGDDGRLLEIVRRKGAKNTLLDPNEAPLDEGVLARLLGGMDADTYELAYGLDHERLRQGGAALRVGKGELGESLFSAATGLTGLHGVLAELQGEAEALYKPQGSKPPLNAALRTYSDAKKRIAQFATTADKWLEVEKQVEDARAKLADLRAARVAASEERERARAVAGAARALDAARARLAEIDEAVATTNAELAAIDAPAELLARAHAIAELQERLGSHRKAQADRPRVAAELEAIEERARRAEHGATKAAGAEPPADAHVRKLAMEAERLRERERSLEARDAEQASAVAHAEQRLAALGSTVDDAALRDALDAARREGDVDARHAAAKARAARERTEAEARWRALGSPTTSFEELASLPVPPSEVAASQAREAAALAERARAVAERRRKLEEDRAENERATSALRAEGDVPTEEALARARADRDALWDAVRGGAGAEATRFERAVRAADEIADRLRREAGRVSRGSELSAAATAIARKLEIAGEEARALEAEATRLEAARAALWKPCGVSGSADELVAWRARYDLAAAAAARAMEAAEDMGEIARTIERVRAPLREALGKDSEGLGHAVGALERAATRLLAAHDKSARERAALESTRDAALREADRIARERAACERERAAWATQWSACARALGLPDGASPEEVTAAMDALADLSRAQADLEKTRRRLDGIDRDAGRFAEDVRAVAVACAPDLAERSPEDACAELARRLARASERRARRETLEEQKRKLDAQAADARAAVEKRAEAAGTADGAASELRASELEGVIAELDDRIAQTSRELGSLEAGATQFDQSLAVEQAAEAQRQLARVRDLAEHYARVRLAGAAVARLLERYRRENQGPVLARASQLFAMLTLGSFEGLEVGFGEADEPVLVAVREGKRLETSALSDGTLDQLYLALRVASLERLGEARGPMPLLLDDVLVHFDDRRAEAALAVLAELAKRTQVILFTHHARIVELARKIVADRDGRAAGIHDLAAT